MRVAYITAGAASMICGSCLKDNALVSALQQQGRDCLLIPTYTPPRTDERDVSLRRVFFSGVSVYLEQKFSWFRRLPEWSDRWLSSPSLLRCVSRFAVDTRAEELADLTLSMLRGPEGYQAREIERLVRWLEQEYRPDLVCLSNILLSGIVGTIKSRLQCPIVVSLQGDDIFLDHLPDSYKSSAIEIIQSNARSIDAYITPCRYYADYMSHYLGLPRDLMYVVYPGINIRAFDEARATIALTSNNRTTDKFRERDYVIGYLARICPEKGLHILVEAVGQLVRQGRPIRLEVAGYLGPQDKGYLEQLKRCAAGQGWSNRFHYWGEVDYQTKVRFLCSLDMLSVPTVYKEPKGLYILEAWAAGVPVVQPSHGSFVELIERSNGGLCVEPNNSQALAEALDSLLQDKTRRHELGQRGRQAVESYFHSQRMAEETWQVWTSVAQSYVHGSYCGSQSSSALS